MKEMEKRWDIESAEILPENIGELPASETSPLLERAASRIDILKPKTPFWEGMAENLKGAAAYLDAKKAELGSKAFRVIAGASLVATMLSACSPIFSPGVSTPEPFRPTAAATIEPTSTTEAEEGDFFRGILADSDDGSLWVIIDEDYRIAGSSAGSFDRWVPEESIPVDERQDEIRWGLWSNREGRGRIRFMRLEGFQGDLNSSIFLADANNGTIWRMVDRDYKLVGDYQGIFDGWVDEASISEDQREEGIRLGRWSNREGYGTVGFARIGGSEETK